MITGLLHSVFSGTLLKNLLSATPANRQGIIALLDQVIASATNFLTGMIIARACSKEEFGIYVLCFNIVMFILDMQTALISSSYMVHSQGMKVKERAEYIGSTMIQQIILSLIVIVTLTAALSFFPKNLIEMGLSPTFHALALVIVFIMFRDFVRRICFADMRMHSAVMVDMTVALLQISGLLVLFLCGNISAQSAFIIIGAACATGSVLWLNVDRSLYKLDMKDFSKSLVKNWSFGSWMFGSTLLWAASMTLYPWLLTWFHGPAAIGIWGACWGVTAIANPLIIGIQNFLGPDIVRSYVSGGISGLNRNIRKKTLMYVTAVTPLAMLLIFSANFLVPFIYGDKYRGTGTIVSILSVTIIINAAAYPISRAILALKEAKIYFFASFVPLLVTLSCGIVLVKQFGPVGVAWGLLIGTLITGAVMAICFISLTRKRKIATK